MGGIPRAGFSLLRVFLTSQPYDRIDFFLFSLRTLERIFNLRLNEIEVLLGLTIKPNCCLCAGLESRPLHLKALFLVEAGGCPVRCQDTTPVLFARNARLDGSSYCSSSISLPSRPIEEVILTVNINHCPWCCVTHDPQKRDCRGSSWIRLDSTLSAPAGWSVCYSNLGVQACAVLISAFIDHIFFPVRHRHCVKTQASAVGLDRCFGVGATGATVQNRVHPNTVRRLREHSNSLQRAHEMDGKTFTAQKGGEVGGYLVPRSQAAPVSTAPRARFEPKQLFDGVFTRRNTVHISRKHLKGASAPNVAQPPRERRVLVKATSYPRCL